LVAILQNEASRDGIAVTIRDWPASERPRERLLTRGAQTLTEAELLAVFPRTGSRQHNVVDLARVALQRFGGLNGLLGANQTQIEELAGFGPGKYAQLQAMVELARRALREELGRVTLLNAPTRVREFLRLRLSHLPHEVFLGLFLDAQNRLLEVDELFRGTLTQTSVYPREVVKQALRHNAAAVIFAHNHPSGVAEPSRADELLTRALKDALALVDVRVLDHLIVAGSASVSLAERGLI